MNVDTAIWFQSRTTSAFAAIGLHTNRAASVTEVRSRVMVRLLQTERRKRTAKTDTTGNPVKCRRFGPDPRGDRSPQGLARGGRDGPGNVDAARPRRAAAHRTSVFARRAGAPQRSGDRIGQRSLPAPGRRPVPRLA